MKNNMYEISKKDWKLFREKLPGWQEKYMERLCKEYIAFLSAENEKASEKFWELEKRIKMDKKRPGVILEMRKSNTIYNIINLINDDVITIDDLDGFSEELKDTVALLRVKILY